MTGNMLQTSCYRYKQSWRREELTRMVADGEDKFCLEKVFVTTDGG